MEHAHPQPPGEVVPGGRSRSPRSARRSPTGRWRLSPSPSWPWSWPSETCRRNGRGDRPPDRFRVRRFDAWSFWSWSCSASPWWPWPRSGRPTRPRRGGVTSPDHCVAGCVPGTTGISGEGAADGNRTRLASLEGWAGPSVRRAVLAYHLLPVVTVIDPLVPFVVARGRPGVCRGTWFSRRSYVSTTAECKRTAQTSTRSTGSCNPPCCAICGWRTPGRPRTSPGRCGPRLPHPSPGS
jgi:hypothetical protein